MEVYHLDPAEMKSDDVLLMELGLPTWLNLADETQTLRNDLLRIGTTAFILAFELAAAWLILFDKGSAIKTEPALETSDMSNSAHDSALPVDTSPGSCSSRWRSMVDGALSLTYTGLLTLVVLIFPYCFAWGYPGFLIPVCCAVGMFFYSREIKSRRLALYPPASPTKAEIAGLLLLSGLTFLLILWRWETIPTGMNGDVATICMSGMDMWTKHLHPFQMNRSTLPGLLDPLYGGGVLLTGSPFFGNRLYPLFCGVLCPIIIYRWVRLIGSREVAWFATLTMIATPFFQYYSRVPMGTSLWLMELIFFYGLTRSLVTNGIRGPLLAGIALALAQWDYYASRILIGVALAAPFLVWPFRKGLAPGWWYRLGVIPLFGITSLFGFHLMIDFVSSKWTFYYTPAFFSVDNSDLARKPDILGQKIMGHLRMWFSPELNESRFMTVPGSPVLFGSFAGLLVVGCGLFFYSILSPPGLLVAITFIAGTACSLVSMGSPNGHRAMIATLPVLLLVSMGLSSLWPSDPMHRGAHPEGDKTGVGIIGWIRRMTVLLLLGWGCLVSLHYFQIDMWKDKRTIRAQQYDENLRSLRIRDNKEKFNIVIVPIARDLDRFIVGPEHFPILNYNNWLPPNWSTRPLSVQATAHVHPFAPFVKSMGPWLTWREFIDPSGAPAGWEYNTEPVKIGSTRVAHQWSRTGRIVGTLMFPQPGQATFLCKGYRIWMDAPISSATAEGKATVQVLRGLNRLSLLATREGQPPPESFHLIYRSISSQTQVYYLKPECLYAIPLGGWLQTVWDGDVRNHSELTPQSISVVPTIFTHHLDEEPIRTKTGKFTTCYQSVPNLPPGLHSFVVQLSNPRILEMQIAGGRVISGGTQEQSRFTFSLEPQEANGKIFEIIRRDTHHPAAISLEVIYPDGIQGIPPYTWFKPTAYDPRR